MDYRLHTLLRAGILAIISQLPSLGNGCIGLSSSAQCFENNAFAVSDSRPETTIYGVVHNT